MQYLQLHWRNQHQPKSVTEIKFDLVSFRGMLMRFVFPWKPSVFGHIYGSISLEAASAASPLRCVRVVSQQRLFAPKIRTLCFLSFITWIPLERGRETHKTVSREPKWADTPSPSVDFRSIPSQFQSCPLLLCVEWRHFFATCCSPCLNLKHVWRPPVCSTLYSLLCFYWSCPHPGPQMCRTNTGINC